MTDWREAYSGDGRRGAGGRRELAQAPWYEREDPNLQRGFGEGEFERGGRPAGGYAQGGHERDRGGGGRGQGYGAYGGGAYRERSEHRRPGQPRSWTEGRRVHDVMSSRAEVLDPDMSLRDAARRMRNDSLGAYPVGEYDRLIGMITDRDIVVRGVANDRQPSRTAIRDVMSERVIYCFEDDDVDDVADLMAEHQVRRIPVLNRNKRLVGMVALADLGLSDEDAATRALHGVSQRTGVPRRY